MSLTPERLVSPKTPSRIRALRPRDQSTEYRLQLLGAVSLVESLIVF
jgi:hypothetical protein